MSGETQAAGSLGRTLEELLAAMAAEEAAPGGGSAAAVCAAMAAALVASVARQSRERWDEAMATAAQAERLRSRAIPLAEMDAQAFRQAMRALAGRRETGSPDRGAELEQSLTRAAELPLEIAEIAADVAELAALTCGQCDPGVQADAVAAAVLGAAAARAAAGLVEINLTMTEADERVAATRSLAARAEASRERALGKRSA